MNLRRSAFLILIGLGAVAGAVLPGSLAAQVPVRRDTIPARRDTLRARADSVAAREARERAGRDTIRVPTPAGADSMLRNDSLARGIVPLPARDTVKKDTLKAPLTRAEAPPVFEIGPARIYDRGALFATGAFTLSDLLGRVPGLTELTTGGIAAPSVIASQGNLRGVRVFLDGLELDPLSMRSQGTTPANDLPLHALEELRIERGAEEVRVYARTWRVDRTDPYTRADIATGDQNTNLYRAYFGRRYSHGEALQISAEQLNTQPNRQLASSGGLHAMARFGLVRGPWSADAFAERSDRDRGPWVGTGNFFETLDTVPALNSRRNTAYLRFGNGDPDRGRWFQALAAVESFRGSPGQPNTFSTGSVTDTVSRDTSSYENQYLLTGGATLLGARVSAADRIRTAGGSTSHVLSARASYDSRFLAASLFGEEKSPFAPGRAEATVRFSPTSRIALVGSASHTSGGVFTRVVGDVQATPELLADGTLVKRAPADPAASYDSTRVGQYELNATNSLRAEAGIRVLDLWISGGVLRRGATTLLSPAEFDTAYARPGALVTEGAATAGTVALRGRLYKAIQIDAWALAWNDTAGAYRPRYQTRTELYIQTSLLDRFPRGNFGLLTSLAHEYRSNTHFPRADGTDRVAEGSRSLSFKLEIRVQTAVVFYQFRNLLQEQYALVPGYNMPRQAQLYGIRWDFWN